MREEQEEESDMVVDEDEMEGDESYQSSDLSSESEEIEEVESSTATSSKYPTPIEAQQSISKTLTELQTAELQLKKQGNLGDQHLWRVKELSETLREAQRQMSEAASQLLTTEAELSASADSHIASLTVSEISSELFDVYSTFCEGLYLQSGLRDGFEVVCGAEHGGSYVKYDSESEV